jgi:hypothetical protein
MSASSIDRQEIEKAEDDRKIMTIKFSRKLWQRVNRLRTNGMVNSFQNVCEIATEEKVLKLEKQYERKIERRMKK